jgi:tetratricopeptide (TPR) repeat protein
MCRWLPFWILCILPAGIGLAATPDPPVKIVEAEATYVMGDADTLTGAEEHALLRAKRKAVETAGVYLEATSEDVERYVNGKASRWNSLAIRTLASAITKTEILEKRRTLEGDRPTFYVKVRVAVQLDVLETAIRRMKADEQLAEHHRQLEAENSELKAQLERIRKNERTSTQPPDRRVPSELPTRRAAALLKSAVQSHDFSTKLQLLEQAAEANPKSPDPYVVRGQTYLRIAAFTRTKSGAASEVDSYVERGLKNFEQALALDPTNTWALLGHGDAQTWKKQAAEAARDYERILELDPSFEIARERLIAIHTAQARQEIGAKRWHQALTTLHRVIEEDAPLQWAEQKLEARLLRSKVYLAMGETHRAIADLSEVIRLDSSNREALVSRGKLFRQARLGHQARTDFEAACRLGEAQACDALQE